ncbi:MAG: serine protease [Sporomusaceae bacterium]|nr:serine protease [Sporomusaceae bacterium]
MKRLSVLVLALIFFSVTFQGVLAAPRMDFKDMKVHQIINEYYSGRELDGVEGLWIYQGQKGPVLIAVLSGAIPDIGDQYRNKKGFVGVMLQPESLWTKGEVRFTINKVLTPHEKYEGSWQGITLYFVYGLPVQSKVGINATFTVIGNTLRLEAEDMGRFDLQRLFPARNPAPGIAGTGSGFFVSPNLVVTNHHVIDSARKVEIRTKDGMWTPATVLASDADYDVAILEVKGLEKTSKPLPIGNSLSVKVGQRVYSFGFPAPSQLSGDISEMQMRMNEGIITSLQGYKGSEKELQVSIPTYGGNSGGPVVNAIGEPIAIITSGLAGNVNEDGIVDVPQNINFARRIERAVELIEQLERFQELSYKDANSGELKTEAMAEQMLDSVVLVRIEGYKREKVVNSLLKIK